MQYLDFKSSNRQAIKLTQYVLLMLACLLFWFSSTTNPICKAIDSQAYLWLNSSMQYSTTLQYIWGYLNHPNESWLNVFVMAGVNILGIYSLAPAFRKKAFIDVLYFWAFFQVILFFTHVIFVDILFVQRNSPSLSLPVTVPLHTILQIPNLKISSTNCFPAGHALIAIYWSCFSQRYAAVWLRSTIYTIAILLILPRLFCGAHWLSDVIFTIFYALFWLELAKYTSIYNTSTKYLSKTLHFIGIKQQRSTQSS